MRRELLADIIEKLVNMDLNMGEEEKLAFITKLVEEAYKYGYQDGKSFFFGAIDRW